MALEAGAKVIYHIVVPEVFFRDGVLAGCIVASKSGLQRIEAKVIIDTLEMQTLLAPAGGALSELEKWGRFNPVPPCSLWPM